MTEPGTPHKHEGDGRSPAGVFPLDTAFGFASPDAMHLHMPYVQLTSANDCVDDTASVHYNTIVSRDAARVDWSSAEHMRQIPQYRIGVVVGYNALPPIKDRGSCIFLHIWAGPRSTTVGCTALDGRALEHLMGWLDRDKRPVLVQMPAGVYDRLRTRWGLPTLN
jgi:D-alanyl-D-alanine dipeptidase